MTDILFPLGNHVWQSTVVAALAGLLTLALRNNRASSRHALWLVASAKFLIPFSVLISLGSLAALRSTPAPIPANFSTGLSIAVQPFIPEQNFAPAHLSSAPSFLPIFLLNLWICGSAVLLFRWAIQWSRAWSLARRASPIIDGPVRDALNHHAPHLPLALSPDTMEPAVFGIFRPVLLLPASIADRLTAAQLEAVLAHEASHAARHDNLAAAIQTLAESIFWFHPLVWWMGARLLDERERACDENVLRLGCHPETYAEAILKVCEFYLSSPACVSGVTGSSLKRRIEQIMTHRAARTMNAARRFLVAGSAAAALALPLAIGILHPQPTRAQSAEPHLEFEVASLKPNNSTDPGFGIGTRPGGELWARNIPLKRLIATAYSVTDYQIFGDVKLLERDRYDLLAKAPGPAALPELRLMLRSLLTERFHLKFHREPREMTVYTLEPLKRGSFAGLVEVPGGDCSSAVTPQAPLPNRTGCGVVLINPKAGWIHGNRARISQLADRLSTLLELNVLDHTALPGLYNITLNWAPEGSTDSDAPPLFAAIQQQLGLEMKKGREPVEVLVIDSVEKPTPN